MQVWEIATPSCAAGIVGTIAKEAGTFAPVREAWWLSDAKRWAYYNDTTQHAAYGGGANFHGRGFVQLTHLGSYRNAEDALNEKLGWDLNLVADPDQALDAIVAAHIICWFFVAKGIVGMCERGAWAEVRKTVWGAYGDADGVAKLQHAARLLL